MNISPTFNFWWLRLWYCCCLVTQLCPTLCDPMEPTRLLGPWDCPGKNIGVGCHFLLQGITPNQGWKLCLYITCIGRVLYH